jgi:hypothetical protein
MKFRRGIAGLVAVGIAVIGVVPASANSGPGLPTTDLSRAMVPFSFHGIDGRTYTGQAFFDRDNLASTTVAGFYFTWRQLEHCDGGTPSDPSDDFEGEELIDFTVDSITPTFAIAPDLSTSSGSATGTGHRIHTTACEGTVIEDVIETHTFAYQVAATGAAKKSQTRDRIDNGDGTITTIVVRETHRNSAGSYSLDVAGTLAPLTGVDVQRVEVTETTR